MVPLRNRNFETQRLVERIWRRHLRIAQSPFFSDRTEAGSAGVRERWDSRSGLSR
jgi:hypothetical protein